MKKILLLTLCCIGLNNLNGQVIFQENFQTTTNLATAGWTLYNDTNTPQAGYAAIFPTAWNIVTWNAETPNVTVSTTSWFTPSAAADRWIVTPAIIIPAGAGAVNLSFRIRSHDTDYPDGYSLKLSTTTNAKTDFTVNLVTVAGAPNTLISATALTTVDLSAYAGQTIRLAWINTSNDKNLLSLDDITVVKSTLSNDSYTSSKFSISPNPTTDIVNISSSENIGVNSVSVADLNGRTVKQLKFNNISNVEVNMSDLSAGMYMMTITSEQGTATKKILKN